MEGDDESMEGADESMEGTDESMEGMEGADESMESMEGTDESMEGMEGMEGDDHSMGITSPLDEAIEGLGGADALENLSSITIESAILRFANGEGPEPNFQTDAPSEMTLSMAYDVQGDNLRLDYVRTTAPAEYSEIISGNLGYIVGRDARFGNSEGANHPSDRVASSRRQQRLLNPHLLLRDALVESALFTHRGAEIIDGVEHRVLILEDDVAPIALFTNSETGTISRLETMENDFWLRDVLIQVNYADWQSTSNGLLFPNQVSITMDGISLHDETRSSVQVNTALDAAMFDFPEGADPTFDADLALGGEKSSQSIQLFSARGFPQMLGLTFISPQELAPGIFHLGGSSHNSLVVEQANGIVVVEAPLYPERSEAVIAWIESQFPDKPITHVIASHHHRDHSSGLRAYVALGATVVMGEGAQEVFDDIFARPSTIVPDALSQSQTAPVIQGVTVGSPLDIPDSERPVKVVAITSGHASDTVFAYVGGDIVFMGDGNAQVPELRAAVEELGLSVSTYAGGHGAATPYALP